jgi:hypothetical protein
MRFKTTRSYENNGEQWRARTSDPLRYSTHRTIRRLRLRIIEFIKERIGLTDHTLVKLPEWQYNLHQMRLENESEPAITETPT